MDTRHFCINPHFCEINNPTQLGNNYLAETKDCVNYEVTG